MFPVNIILMMPETKLIILLNRLRPVISRHLVLDKEMPEDGYHGADIIGIGKTLAKEFGDKYVNIDEQDRFEFFREYGLN